MSGILFLAHRLPFPPDRGDKIRSHHIVNALARLAPVHVGCFAESSADYAHEGELALVATSHCMPLRNLSRPIAGMKALARSLPVSLTGFWNRDLATWVEATVAREQIETIYVFSGQMGQYVPTGWKGRLIVDLVDVDSAKFEAYSRQGRGPMAWVNAREGRFLAREEERLAARADRTLLVSEAEAALLRSRAPDARRVEALGNGIDASAFDPATVPPCAEFDGPGPHFVFTGQMDYPPNVAAALRVIERLLPAIRLTHPDAQFHVVGRAPTAALRAHDHRSGVRVWGEVPDVRPYLAAADVVIAPLEIARGVQNKVLEAMAMARPVLLTPDAATGIEARDGEHFAVAATDAELIAKARWLVENKDAAAALGQAARRFVLEVQSWAAMLAGLPAIVGCPSEPSEKRDAA